MGKKKPIAEGDEPRKKRGNPSDFKGSRLEFLTSRIPEYLAASKRKKTSEFWASFFHDYWRMFPWRLTLDQEPPAGCTLPPATAEEAFKALDLELSPEDEERKAKILGATKTKIKMWFNRQRPNHVTTHLNPYFDYLTRMRGESGARPKRLPDFQFYLRHKDFKAAIGKRFDEEYSGQPRNMHISLRNTLAYKMLGEESDEVKERVKAEGDAVHAAAVAEWEENDEGMPSPDPDVQQQCRDNFAATVAPLLSGLRAYTGYTINIVAARFNGTDFETCSANAGTVAGQDWAKFDAVGYGEMLPRFLKFVHAEYLENSAAGAGTTSAPPDAPMLPVGVNLITMSDTDINMEPPVPVPVPVPVPAPLAPADTGPESDLPPLLEDDADILMGPSSWLPPPPPVTPVPTSTPELPVPQLPVPLPAAPPAPLPAAPPAPLPAAAPAAAARGRPKPKPVVKPKPIAKPTPAPAPKPAPLPAAEPPTPLPAAHPDAPAPAPAPPREAFATGLARIKALESLVPPEEVFGVRQMSVALRDKMLSMPEGDRDYYARRLQRMPSLELTREMNVARNEAWTAELGLGSTAAFVGMKRGPEKGDKRKTKRVKKNEEEDWTESDKDSSSREENEAGGRASPPATRGKTKGNEVTGSSGAAWAEKGKKILLAVEMGEEWEGLVGLWWRLEEDAGFVCGTKPHSPTLRPKVISGWVRSARTSQPQVSLLTFPKEWWSWWKDINPKWQLSGGELVRDGGGSWDALICPGQNGFLNVLVCLKWWRVALGTSGDRTDWLRAVDDVKWVLEQMTSAQREEGANTTDGPSPSTETPPLPPTLLTPPTPSLPLTLPHPPPNAPMTLPQTVNDDGGSTTPGIPAPSSLPTPTGLPAASAAAPATAPPIPPEPEAVLDDDASSGEAAHANANSGVSPEHAEANAQAAPGRPLRKSTRNAGGKEKPPVALQAASSSGKAVAKERARGRRAGLRALDG